MHDFWDLADRTIEKNVRARFARGGVEVDPREVEALLRIITEQSTEIKRLRADISCSRPQVVNSSGVDEEPVLWRQLPGREVTLRAQEEGLTVFEFLQKNHIRVRGGWNGKCVECKGDGPFRLPPENSKYKYTEICAWCRAMILKEDRETHPKAKDGGPA